MRELVCNYKEEQYSVRDNGEVLRFPRIGKKQRSADNHWTFGKLNRRTGYLEIASVRVHRIIATAFHGPAPTQEHVVDHVDTNKQNNRPENLRWVTRLENILLNPITARRIMIVCGSVEAFLANPSAFRDKFPDPNYNWMCTVSAEEAEISLNRLLAWAKIDKMPSGGTLGEWIFNRPAPQDYQIENIPDADDRVHAKTLNAIQRNWKTPSEFPCCPQEETENPLNAYAQKLITGFVFCSNDLYTSMVSKVGISTDNQSIFVISESKESVKQWALAKITYEDGLFVHTSLGTFFEQNGVEKRFCLEQGMEWFGGDSIDDYC